MHKTWNCDRLQGFADEVLKMVKGADQEKIPEQTKGVFPEAHKGSTTSMVALILMKSRQKQKLTAREVLCHTRF
jgi:hypothetical protein